MTKQKVEQYINLTDEMLSFVRNDSLLLEDETSQNILLNTNENLRDRRYVISVIAAMKAGKSTTFNALLGRDILPNENKSCTAAITEIKHSKKLADEVLKVYKDGTVKSILATNELTLEEKFHEDVRSSRKNNEVSKIEKYYLETPIYAIEDSEYSNLVQNFILVDTPGPNEANVNDEFDVSELQRVALDKLRHSDALIMLFDYQSYQSDTNANILKSIFENREDLAKDRDKIYFLVNKIDSITSRDGSVESVIENVKKIIKYYAPFIEDPQVFPLSAKKASLARSFLKGNTNQYIVEEIEKYAVDYQEKVEINGKIFTLMPEPNEYAQQLLEDSNILGIEKNIIGRTFSQASAKMLDNAKARVEQICQNVTSVANAQIELASQNENELVSKVNENKSKIESLRAESEQLSTFVVEELAALKAEAKNVLAEIPASIEGIVKNKMLEDTIAGTDQLSLKKQAEALKENVVESIQFKLNKDLDRVQRLVLEKQSVINQGLNDRFNKLSQKANELVGTDISLRFQVFNMEDIPLNSKGIEVLSDVKVNGKKTPVRHQEDPFEVVLKKTLTGAGTGFGAGIVLPGIGNLAGALVGGIAGLINGLMSTNSHTYEEQQTYTVDLTNMRKSILKEAQNSVVLFVKEVDESIDEVNIRYKSYVESQMNIFIQNLKDQLDGILQDFIKNKHNLEQHIKHMHEIQDQMNEFNKKNQKIYIGVGGKHSVIV